jgi:hypothetical protein
MPEIPLTQGQVAIVDDIDYEFLMQWKWCTLYVARKYRAMRNVRRSEGRKTTTAYMHREIAQRMGTPGPRIGHRDGDPLNNRRNNLIEVTRRFPSA